jgi:hypothetical protein
VLGVSGDALLRAGLDGVALPLWMTIVGMICLALVWRDGRRLTTEQGWWLAATVAFTIPAALWDGGPLLALDVVAALLATWSGPSRPASRAPWARWCRWC